MFAIPFRPSWDSANCTDPSTDIPFGGRWFDPVLGFCVHGYNTPITFDFSSSALTLPEEVIVSVAYNTADYGAVPINSPGPFNSLNYGLLDVAPSTGTDAEPDTTFWDTSFAGFYCDGGAGGVGTFRRDADCWAPYTPAMQVDTVECAPCDYAALINPFLPKGERLSRTDPCFGTPVPAQPTDACCGALIMTLPFLPKAPTLSSTHPCYVAP